MVKLYEETRKNKILKEKAANESRRHTDNFTANQKAPSLMLHRYDDDNIMNTVNYKVAKAIHDFSGYNKKLVNVDFDILTSLVNNKHIPKSFLVNFHSKKVTF